jgi:hypothetical protein
MDTLKALSVGLIVVGVINSMQVSAQTTRDKLTVAGQHNTTSLSHVRNSFELTVHAPYKVAAPLFGPEGERSWAGADWDPQFIYPHPAMDREGAVFTVKHGSHQSIWVNTAFDLDGRHFQYVYFVDNVMVTVINLRFQPIDSGETRVSVVYERTALRHEANQHVQKLGIADRDNGKRWEKTVNDYLRKQAP